MAGPRGDNTPAEGTDSSASDAKISTKRKNEMDQTQSAKRPRLSDMTGIVGLGCETEEQLSKRYLLSDVLAPEIFSEITQKNLRLLRYALELGVKPNELFIDTETLTLKWIGMNDITKPAEGKLLWHVAPLPPIWIPDCTAYCPKFRALISQGDWGYDDATPGEFELSQVKGMLDLIPTNAPFEWKTVARSLDKLPQRIFGANFLDALKLLEDTIIAPLRALTARSQDATWAPQGDEELKFIANIPRTLLLGTAELAANDLVNITNLEDFWKSSIEPAMRARGSPHRSQINIAFQLHKLEGGWKAMRPGVVEILEHPDVADQLFIYGQIRKAVDVAKLHRGSEAA
ncbi:hypothetical protein QQX98_011282 [Neonectria punicea]|uniref:Uncharacterized protein n=1 Tax=Neonectria punicea TaxID=979145 RepID=A0ABR1GM63_9HYPO